MDNVFKYGEKEVLADLKKFASVGFDENMFVPSFFGDVKELLKPETEAFKKYYEDSDHKVAFFWHDDYMDYPKEKEPEKGKKKKPKKKTALDTKQFDEGKFKADYEAEFKNYLKYLPTIELKDGFVNQRIKKAKKNDAGAFVYQDIIFDKDDAKVIPFLYMNYNSGNPVKSIITFYHEISHVIQMKNYFPNVIEKRDKKSWDARLTENTRSRQKQYDQTNLEFKDFNDKKYYEIEVIAETFGPVCTMLKAYSTGDDVFINDTIKTIQNRVLERGNNRVSNNSLNSLAYFSYPVLKHLLPTITRENYQEFLTKDNNINYDKVYKNCFRYFRKYKYKYEQFMDFADNERKIIDKTIMDKDKNKFKKNIEKAKIKHKNNRIIMDLIEAKEEFDKIELNKEEQAKAFLGKAFYSFDFDKMREEFPLMKKEIIEYQKQWSKNLSKKDKIRNKNRKKIITKAVKKERDENPSPLRKIVKKVDKKVESVVKPTFKKIKEKFDLKKKKKVEDKDLER